MNDYGGPSLQRFQHDDLYRLTKAQGVFPANSNAALADKRASISPIGTGERRGLACIAR